VGNICSRTDTADHLDHAAENGYAISFNVNNMERIQAIMKAAHETDGPIDFTNFSRCCHLCGKLPAPPDFWRRCIPNNPIAMHQDHSNSPATCCSAIKHGFTSVTMDGSLEADAKTPASFEGTTLN